MNKLFWLIYIQPLHRIMIFMILAAVLWVYLGNREQGSRRWRILNAAVFCRDRGGDLLYDDLRKRGRNGGSCACSISELPGG